MTDVFINNMQLNTPSVKCKILSTGVDQTFNVADYTMKRPLSFPLGRNSNRYNIEFILHASGGDSYDALLAAESMIDGAIRSRVSNKQGIQIKTSDTPIYFSNYAVNLVVEDNAYSRRATDGKNFITLRFDGTIDSFPDDYLEFSVPECGTIGVCEIGGYEIMGCCDDIELPTSTLGIAGHQIASREMGVF